MKTELKKCLQNNHCTMMMFERVCASILHVRLISFNVFIVSHNYLRIHKIIFILLY